MALLNPLNIPSACPPNQPSNAEVAEALRLGAAAERRRAEWVREMAEGLPVLAATAAARHASAHELKSLVFDLQSEAFDR